MSFEINLQCQKEMKVSIDSLGVEFEKGKLLVFKQKYKRYRICFITKILLSRGTEKENYSQ